MEKEKFRNANGEIKFSLQKAMHMTDAEWKQYMIWVKEEHNE